MYNYKERSYVQTYELIETFFVSRGYSFKIDRLIESEIGTWSCRATIWLENYLIQTAYGKGLCSDSCKASAAGELYERFCNQMGFLYHPCTNQAIFQYNTTHQGYMFHPEERQISLDTIFSYIDLPMYFHGISAQEHSSNLKRYFSLIFEETFIGVPYTKLSSTEDKL